MVRMSGGLRGLALANLTVVLLLLFWEEIEAFRFLFLIYLVINTVALLIIAGSISELTAEIEELKKRGKR